MNSPKNQGQQFIDPVEHSLEDNGNRPKGMPPFSEIETELKRHGYARIDAEDVYDYWLGNGFMTGRTKVKDWRACIRRMIRMKVLPTQRLPPPGLVQHRLEKPAQLAEARRDRLKGREATDEERQRMGHALRQWRKSQ